MANSGGTPKCLFCRGEAVFYFEKRADQGIYPIFRCVSCHSAFTWPRPSTQDSLNIYRSKDYSNVSMDRADELDRDYHPNSRGDSLRIIARCRELAKGNSLFDIGAGHGIFSQAAQEAGFAVHACEPSPKARVVYASRLGKKPEACAFDGKAAARSKGQFDVVLLSQTLEHIPEPEIMVRDLHTVLKVGGIAAIAVPHFGSALSKLQGRRDTFISPPEHLNFFSRKGLVALFTRLGFALERMETVSKIPKKYVRRILRLPFLTEVGWRTGYGVMRLSDYLGLGMVLNAYFRKK